MARLADGALEQHRGRSKRGRASERALARAAARSSGTWHQAHAATAAAGGGLDHQRVTDPACSPAWPASRRTGPRRRSRECRARRPPASGVWPGPCRPSPVSRQPAGRPRPGRRPARLAQNPRSRPGSRSPDEPPARRGLRGGKICADVQVGVARRRAADRDGLVGQQHMWRAGIGIGVHRDDAQAHAPGAAHDTQRDLAAVGDQQGMEAALRCRGHGRIRCRVHGRATANCIGRSCAVARRGTGPGTSPARRAYRAGR
jgi:hypothetical protein